MSYWVLKTVDGPYYGISVGPFINVSEKLEDAVKWSSHNKVKDFLKDSVSKAVDDIFKIDYMSDHDNTDFFEYAQEHSLLDDIHMFFFSEDFEIHELDENGNVLQEFEISLDKTINKIILDRIYTRDSTAYLRPWHLAVRDFMKNDFGEDYTYVSVNWEIDFNAIPTDNPCNFETVQDLIIHKSLEDSNVRKKTIFKNSLMSDGSILTSLRFKSKDDLTIWSLASNLKEIERKIYSEEECFKKAKGLIVLFNLID